MAYVDGFLIPVETARKQEFVDHAKQMDALLIAEGALRVVETWGYNVPEGKVTDFRRAVQATLTENVAFSWIEWPDKATRDAAFAKFEKDERMMQVPMPFDGKRMVFGGFEKIVERGDPGSFPYVQGFVIPVAEAKRDAYKKMAEDAWEMFADYGALNVVETWGDDVPEGKQTDFYRAVQAEPGEKVVFSWMAWPSREVCDAAQQRMMTDERMEMPEGFEMPFDGKRMVFAGFEPVVVMGAGQ